MKLRHTLFLAALAAILWGGYIYATSNVFEDVVNLLDDVDLEFGTDNDIQVRYDEAGDNRLEWHDGTNLLAHLTDQGTTGLLTVTGDIATGDDMLCGDDLTLNSASAQATVGNGTGAPSVTINGGAGNHRSVTFQTAGVNRWLIRADLTAEGGADAGSNFEIWARTDESGIIDVPFEIGRAAAADITMLRDVVIGEDTTTQGTLTLWDGGGTTPGYIKIASPNGTVWYLFIEDDGTLKYSSGVPDDITDGDAVGDQTD